MSPCVGNTCQANINNKMYTVVNSGAHMFPWSSTLMNRAVRKYGYTPKV